MDKKTTHGQLARPKESSVTPQQVVEVAEQRRERLVEVGEILGAAADETVEDAARRVVQGNIMLKELKTLQHSLQAVSTLCAERGQGFEYNVGAVHRSLQVQVTFRPRWGEDMLLTFTAVGGNNTSVLTELKRKMEAASKGLALFNGTFGG